ERQPQAVRERLEQAERADRVGTGAHLHAGHHARLVPDREKRHDDEKDEDREDFGQHEPPDVVAELVQRALHRTPPAPMSTVEPAVTPSVRRAVESAELVGTHSTRPAMSSTISAGKVMLPRSVETVTASPSATPRSAASALPSRTSDGRAVPARYSSPSCNE